MRWMGTAVRLLIGAAAASATGGVVAGLVSMPVVGVAKVGWEALGTSVAGTVLLSPIVATVGAGVGLMATPLVFAMGAPLWLAGARHPIFRHAATWLVVALALPALVAIQAWSESRIDWTSDGVFWLIAVSIGAAAAAPVYRALMLHILTPPAA